MDANRGPLLLSDQQLLEGLRRQDQRIWRLVYNGHRLKVVNFLRGRGASDEVALSIYQDTMVFLDTQKDHLVLTSKLSTYLIGVAFHKLREYWREQTRNAKRSGADIEQQLNKRRPTDDDPDEAELALIQLASEDSTRFDFDNGELDVLVQQALAQIPLKHCANIFQLRYWDGMDDQQIASRLALSHGSVRNQVVDCKKKVKSILLGMGWGR